MSASDQQPAARWWMFAAVFMVALLVRLIYLIEIKDSVVFSVLVSDGHYYDQIAQKIAAGNWLGGDAFYQAPLYPYFLAVVYKVFDHDLVVLRVVQSLLGAAACVFVAMAGRDFFSPRVGLAAGILYACYAPGIFFDGLVQKTVLDSFLLSLLLMLLGRSWRDRRAWWFAAVGMAVGLLTLNRSNAIILAAVIAGWVLIEFRHEPFRQRCRRVGLFGLGMGLVFLPVGLRNQVVAGDFFLTAEQVGPVFFMGNNERADGRYLPLGRRSGPDDRRDWEELAAKIAGRQLSPAESNAFWMQQALTFIREQPQRWLRLTFRKCLLMWNTQEITDSDDPAVYADQSRLWRWLQGIVCFGTLAPLGLAGIWVTWKERQTLWLLYIFLLSLTVTTALFFVSGRYRYPLVPVLVLFAAAGLWRMAGWLRHRQPRPLLTAISVMVVAGVIVHWRLLPPETPRVVAYHNLGVTLAETGRTAEAIRCYSTALEILPGFVPSRVNLAEALAATGQTNQAIAQLQRVLQGHPDNTVARQVLANLLSKGNPR